MVFFNFYFFLDKKYFFNILFFLFSTFSSNSQVNPFSTPLKTEYKPLNLERYAQPLAQRQAMYNQNYAYLQDLSKWINKINSEVEDKELNVNLNTYLRYLNSYKEMDLSIFYKDLKQIETWISEEINQYNKRIKEQNNPNIYWQDGNNAYQQKNYKYAIEKYDKVIQLSPEFYSAYYQRGLSNYQIGNYSNAINDLTVFIENDKATQESYLYRGWSFNEISKSENALNDMNKCVEMNPNDPYSFYSRGVILIDLKQYDKAIEDYKVAIKLKPDFSMAYNNLAWVKFLQKQYSQALIFADQALKIDSTNSVAFDTRADIKFNLNDYKGCIVDADQALLINPNINNCYLLKGRANYRLGKKSEACTEWQKSLDMGNLDALSYLSQYCK